MLIRTLGSAYTRVGTFADYEATLARVREIGASPEGTRVVRGHMTAGVRQWLPPDTRLFTIVRRPVDRVVSHYNHMRERSKPNRPFGLPPMPKSLTLEECVAAGEYIPDNLMTRMLSDSPTPLGPVDPARLEEAKRNIDEVFAVVGLSERYDESVVLIQRTLGLPPATYRRIGDSKGESAASLPAETIRLIEERNDLDAVLYEAACERFARDWQRAAEDAACRLDLEALERSQELLAGRAPGAFVTRDPLEQRLVERSAAALVAELELAETRADLRVLTRQHHHARLSLKRTERARGRLERRLAEAEVGLPQRFVGTARRRLAGLRRRRG